MHHHHHVFVGACVVPRVSNVGHAGSFFQEGRERECGGEGGSVVGQTVGPSMRERGGAWALPQRVKR